MDWKKVIGLLVVAGLVISAIVTFALKEPIKFKPFREEGISSMVPDWKGQRYCKKGWEGWTFKARFALFRVLWQKTAQPDLFLTQLLPSIKKPKYTFKLSLFGGGYYFVRKLEHGYEIVVIFKDHDKVFWVDLSTRSTFRKYKKVLDTFLINLKINGQKVSPRAVEEILKTDREISPLMMQDENIIIFLIAAVFVVIISVSLLFFKLSGRCPQMMDALLCSPMSTLWEKTPMRSTITTCCVCLKGNKIEVYVRGKLKFEFDLSDLNEEFYRKGKIKFGNYIIKINNFHRWFPYLPAQR